LDDPEHAESIQRSRHPVEKGFSRTLKAGRRADTDGRRLLVGDDPKAYNVRVGALRQRNELVPRRQLFVRSQQSWINNLNSIRKFDKIPAPWPDR
jgi:hypothetical protein